MTKYVSLLKNSGLKSTFQRIHMLENIASCGHMSIDDIYEKVVKIHPSLSLATVYKNIILMVEKGVLTEVPITGKKSKYELSKEDHIHLICIACGKVEDKPHNLHINTICTSMSKEENFVLNKQQINLYGKCITCHATPNV
ncbi:MAG: transcriptional repressor [Sulfurovum sp.]|nr:MAG: transcriptional repressor [Sulfurovum sp.]RUM71000.1 MAG: transcriptional repressor [Sulfurovum sp.]